MEAGLKGIEAHYMTHTRSQVERLIEIARTFGLRLTGGSDYHGPRTGRESAGGVEFSDKDFAEIEEHLALS